MKRLWAPWRLNYVLAAKEKECIFCVKPGQDSDRENFILHRGEHNFIILNIYPYNNGHMMVVPYRHAADYADLTRAEVAEMGVFTQKGISVLRERLRAEGFNFGMNIGSVGGAGIAEHVHMHIVPRWNGDTNFMPVVGDTKIMVQHIHQTYDLLADAFKDFGSR